MSATRNVTCLGVLLLLAATAARAQEAFEVTASVLNVRAGPGTAHAPIGLARQGEVYPALARQGEWVRLQFGARIGWSHGTYLRASSAEVKTVAAVALNVRSGGGVRFHSLGQLPRGARVAIRGHGGEWRRIDFEGREGWIHGAYLVAPGGSTPVAPPPPPALTGWQALHRGLTLDGAQVPRRGLSNGTLRNTLGLSVEPLGDQVQRDGRAFVRGRLSWFGGRLDSGVTPTETGAITGERLRDLNTPLSPPATALAQRPGDFYYAAMRFDYSPRPRAWWARARLLVLDPQSGRAVVVRCVDWGPNTNTGRVIDLSPQTLRDLGLATDATVLISFAPPDAPLGPVTGP